jgi:hypothetical protein
VSLDVDMAAVMSRGKKVCTGEFFTVFYNEVRENRRKTGPFKWASMKPAVGSAEIRELPGRAGPITQFFCSPRSCPQSRHERSVRDGGLALNVIED